LNRIRDTKNRKETELLEAVSKTEEETPDIQYEREEMKKKIEAALMKLKTSDREIIILKEFENYSYKEISEMIDIPAGSVMSRLFYARKKVASLLKEEEK
jgi:RNA polymerase sigma-70 factor (ECF subfamily)